MCVYMPIKSCIINFQLGFAHALRMVDVGRRARDCWPEMLLICSSAYTPTRSELMYAFHRCSLRCKKLCRNDTTRTSRCTRTHRNAAIACAMVDAALCVRMRTHTHIISSAIDRGQTSTSTRTYITTLFRMADTLDVCTAPMLVAMHCFIC